MIVLTRSRSTHTLVDLVLIQILTTSRSTCCSRSSLESFLLLLMDEYRLEYHDELQEPNINSSGNSPLRKYLKRRRAQVINLPPPEDDDDRENSDSDSVVEDTAPLPDAEKLRQRVSVKQALGGLFSPESLTSTTAGATADR